MGQMPTVSFLMSLEEGELFKLGLVRKGERGGQVLGRGPSHLH